MTEHKESGGLTLDATLRRLGFGHRATPNTPNTHKREIFRIKGGEVVANLTAHEAWHWLSKQAAS